MKKWSVLLLIVIILCALFGIFACSKSGADSPEAALVQYVRGISALDAEKTIAATQYCDDVTKRVVDSLTKEDLNQLRDDMYTKDIIDREFGGDIRKYAETAWQFEATHLKRVLAERQQAGEEAYSEKDIRIEFVTVEQPVRDQEALEYLTYWFSDVHKLPWEDTAYIKYNGINLKNGRAGTEEEYLFKLDGKWYVFDKGNWHYY